MADIIKNKVTVNIPDEVRCKFIGIRTDHVEYLYNKYSLYVEGYKYMPNYQLGVWDGKKQFFYKDGSTFVYLMPEIIKALKKIGYQDIQILDNRQALYYDVTADVDDQYFSHITSSKTNKPYKLIDHQVEAANTMISAGSGIALAGTGFGKAQPYHCKIMTPYGWSTMGKIKSGDLICTPKNTISRVLYTFEQGVTEVYRITLFDGTVTYAHPEHLWLIYNPNHLTSVYNSSEYVTKTTLELQDMLKTNSVFIPTFLFATDLPKKKLPVDPYLLGSILPFVKCDNNGIYYTVSGPDCTLSKQGMQDRYRSFGFIVTNDPQVNKVRTKWRLAADNDHLNYVLDFIYDNLQQEYRIPSDYIFGSAEDRLKFLQGFCDTGGECSTIGTIRVSCAFSTTLREQLVEMVVMQGGTLNDMYTVPTHSHYYNLLIIHRVPEIFLTDIKKKELFLLYNGDTTTSKKGITTTHRRIKDIAFHKREKTKCIYVEDKDHLYVTDGGIITHNTILNAVLVDKYKRQGCKTLTIVPAKSLIHQTIKQFKELELDVSHFHSGSPSIDHDHIISTWQTLQNYPLVIKEFQMIVVDECLDGQTPILLADNVWKCIKDIKPGELIISYNVTTNVFEEDVVVELYENLLKSSNEKMYRLEFDNGFMIDVTGNHEFLTDQGYIRADQLKDEHEIINF